MSDPKKQYYAVSCGRKTGIFRTWALCNKQVTRYSGECHEGFLLIDEAVNFLVSHGFEQSQIQVFDGKGLEHSLQDFLIDVLPKEQQLFVSLPPIHEAAKVMDENHESTGLKPVINNALLSYMLFAMQSSSAEKIKKVILAHFTIDDIVAAKDALWDMADHNIIGERKRRQDSTSRSEKEAHTTDILTSMSQLDSANMMPDIVINALSLGLIPRSHPEELEDISLADRMNKLEQRVSNLSGILDETICGNLTLKDQVSDLQRKSVNDVPSYAAKLSVQHFPHFNETVPSNNVASEASSQGNDRVATPSSIQPSVRARVSPNSCDNFGDITGKAATNDGFILPSYTAKQMRRVAGRTQKREAVQVDGPSTQRAKKRRVVQGTRTKTHIRGAPEPMRDVFIYRVLSDTTTDMMTKHIQDMGITICNLECVSNPNAKYKSFKLSTYLSNYKDVFDPDMWPEGIRVRRFNQPRSDHADDASNNGYVSS